MARKPGKSESLTIRLDPKTRFMLEFIAKLKGQPLTTVVERAISSAADATTILHEGGFRKGDEYTESWRDYWSVEEGERALKMAAEPALHPTYEEDRRLAFAKLHWPFFYTEKNRSTLMTGYIEVLWPRIDEFVLLHEHKKHEDYFAAGKAMQVALKAANIKAPEWPIEESKPRRPSSQAPAFEPGGIDDDIPF